MTSGEIVGKMDTQKLLNVPLYNEVVARKPDVVEASKASQFIGNRIAENGAGRGGENSFTREISQGNFKGSQKHSPRLSKQRYAISPGKGKMHYSPPPETRARTRRTRRRWWSWTQEAQNTPFCPLQEKVHTAVLEGVRNVSDTLETRL